MGRGTYNESRNSKTGGISMGIRFSCPNGHKLHVKEFLAGKRGICPECGAKFTIPLQQKATAPAAVGPPAAGSTTASAPSIIIRVAEPALEPANEARLPAQSDPPTFDFPAEALVPSTKPRPNVTSSQPSGLGDAAPQQIAPSPNRRAQSRQMQLALAIVLLVIVIVLAVALVLVLRRNPTSTTARAGKTSPLAYIESPPYFAKTPT
jgi:hypothetical protein